MEGLKLTEKMKDGNFKGVALSQVIETDVNHVKDRVENYGLELEPVAKAYYTFHLDRVDDQIKNTMY